MHILIDKDIDFTLSYLGQPVGVQSIKKRVKISIGTLTLTENKAGVSTVLLVEGIESQGLRYEFDYDPVGASPYDQAFSYLMTLDDFTGGVLVND